MCKQCKALKPTWERLATIYANEKDVIIGSVDCDDFRELAAANNVMGYPHIKYFGRDGADPEDYNEPGRTVEDFTKFINERTGLDISPDGGVTPTGGIVAEIAEYVKSFVSASTDDERKEVLNTCHEAVDKLDETAKKNFKYYAKVFAKISEKGQGYIAKERERLSKMLESSDNLKDTQKRSFMRRINVLSTFDEL